MKYLICGLGNIGAEYADTRHNIGFMVLDELAKQHNTSFSLARHATCAEIKYKGRTLLLVKPTTYMNLSGMAVKYWLQQEKIPVSNLLVITDDIALPFAKLRLRPSGSAGGHNGLKSINEQIGTEAYARLRMGVGSDFAKGRQADYVLSSFSSEEQRDLPFLIQKAAQGALDFSVMDMPLVMNTLNK